MTAQRFEGLTIAVIGSCQVSGLASAISALLPGAVVNPFLVDVHPITSRSELGEQLRSCDFVITQLKSNDDTDDPLNFDRLTEFSRVEYQPVFVFAGITPDMEYIFLGSEIDGRHVTGPIHSTILAAAYIMGLSPRRAINLYNSYIFGRLGYFGAYNTAKEFAVTVFEQAGYDISQLFVAWEKSGPFMYTFNHPAAFVLASLGRLIVNKLGLRQVDEDPEGLADALAMSLIWPIFPEIAQRAGLPSRELIRLPVRASGEFPTMTLLDYASASYRTFEKADRAKIMTPRVIWTVDRLKDVVLV